MLHCYENLKTDLEKNVFMFYLSKFSLLVVRRKRHVRTNMNSLVPYLACKGQGYCTVIHPWHQTPQRARLVETIFKGMLLLYSG